MNTNERISIDDKTLALLRGENERERILHRLHSVALVLSGLSAHQASAIYGDSPRAVANWVKRFKTNGITGLHETKGRGRIARLTAAQKKQLQTFMRAQARAGELVNASVLAAHIKKTFKIAYAPRQCWRLIKELS